MKIYENKEEFSKLKEVVENLNMTRINDTDTGFMFAEAISW